MKIQEIRARQACEEARIKKPVIQIDHATPLTVVNGVSRTLLFPKYLLDYNIPFESKDIDIMFMGKVTDKRKVFLREAIKKYPNLKIFDSDRGRELAYKVMDDTYWQFMARAKFVLCPDGDFAWTYRFFEATLVRAIPVIQTEASCYEGYNFYRLGDELTYWQFEADNNFNKAKAELML